MQRNPCRHCSSSFEHNGMHSPGYADECKKCERIKHHREYLQTKRKFIVGEPITSLDELLRQEWVMWYRNTKHIEVFKNTQLKSVLNWLRLGAFHKAIRKESEEN